MSNLQATQSHSANNHLRSAQVNAGTHPDAVNLPMQGSSEAVALSVLVFPSFSADQTSTGGFFAVNGGGSGLYRVSGKIGR